jgi:glycosyltransferase involved in cell wall biosynthesis
VQEGPKILGLGRLHWQKGFDVLLRALAIIRKERNWSLVLAGDGPERDSLRALAAELSIRGSVAFVGPVEDPYPLYAWSDLVVVPSRYEGFPNVLLEALACGKPVVATDCRTGPREVTAMGQHGVLVPVDDATSLARAIVSLGEEQRLSRKLGAAAQEHIRRYYDHAAVIPSIRDIVLR